MGSILNKSVLDSKDYNDPESVLYRGVLEDLDGIFKSKRDVKSWGKLLIGGKNHDVWEFPKSGFHFEGRVAYNLTVFDIFFRDYGTKFESEFVLAYSTEYISDVNLNGKKFKFYAEAGSYLSLTANNKDGTMVIGVGKNIDFLREGTSRIFGSLYHDDYFVPLNKISNSIHTHPPAGEYRYKYINTYYPLTSSRGPSNTDFENGKYKKYKSVIIDDLYIYLYNYNRDLIIYKRK